MPYVERVTKAGNTIEIERYFTSRYKKKGISRGDKVKPTKEEQEKVNTRQAERKLRILINANYGYGDYHLVLDYIRRKGEPDRTPEQMRQDIDVFLRECRKEYRKAGLDVVGHINTRDKAQALELRRRMLKIFNPELSATLVYEYGGFKRVIDCRAYGEPKILKKEVLYEFDLQIECLNPFWREEEETKEDIASWVAAWHFPYAEQLTEHL